MKFENRDENSNILTIFSNSIFYKAKLNKYTQPQMINKNMACNTSSIRPALKKQPKILMNDNSNHLNIREKKQLILYNKKKNHSSINLNHNLACENLREFKRSYSCNYIINDNNYSVYHIHPLLEQIAKKIDKKIKINKSRNNSDNHSTNKNSTIPGYNLNLFNKSSDKLIFYEKSKTIRERNNSMNNNHPYNKCNYVKKDRTYKTQDIDFKLLIQKEFDKLQVKKKVPFSSVNKNVNSQYTYLCDEGYAEQFKNYKKYKQSHEKYIPLCKKKKFK